MITRFQALNLEEIGVEEAAKRTVNVIEEVRKSVYLRMALQKLEEWIREYTVLKKYRFRNRYITLIRRQMDAIKNKKVREQVRITINKALKRVSDLDLRNPESAFTKDDDSRSNKTDAVKVSQMDPQLRETMSKKLQRFAYKFLYKQKRVGGSILLPIPRKNMATTCDVTYGKDGSRYYGTFCQNFSLDPSIMSFIHAMLRSVGYDVAFPGSILVQLDRGASHGEPSEDDFNYKVIREPKSRFLVLHVELMRLKGKIGHANLLIIDTQNRTIERFEPHGKNSKTTAKMAGLEKWSETPLKEHIIDTAIMDVLMHENPTFESFTYLFPTGAPLQGFDGFCATWVYFYLIHRLLYPDIPRTELSVLLRQELHTDPNYIARFASYLSICRHEFFAPFPFKKQRKQSRVLDRGLEFKFADEHPSSTQPESAKRRRRLGRSESRSRSLSSSGRAKVRRVSSS
jgi:hypothetical protein